MVCILIKKKLFRRILRLILVSMMMKVKLNFNKLFNVFNRNIFEILINYDNFIEVYYGGGLSGKFYGVI